MLVLAPAACALAGGGLSRLLTRFLTPVPTTQRRQKVVVT